MNIFWPEYAEVFRRRRFVAGTLLLALTVACDRREELGPLPPDSFAFGLFGDGPYTVFDNARYRRVLEEVSGAELRWFLHVGDILSRPCSDEVFADRLASMESLPLPVIYTPGDNEWVDCYGRRKGGYDPLERLQRIRQMFFADPHTSLGGRSMRVETQAEDSIFGEFVENVRWREGRLLFATLHIVGSDNGVVDSSRRAGADEREAERRTEAAIAWMDEAFRIARDEQRAGVVLALHGNPRLEAPPEARGPYAGLVARLQQLTASFNGSVLLIHGDTHTLRLDQPLVHPTSGAVLPNFTRLETYGSPNIGWVRVIMDATTGQLVRIEKRLIPGWILW